MNAIKFIAICAILTGASATFGHESRQGQPMHATAEQKPWGIAGEAKAVTRTITIRMSDTMRFTPARIEVKQGQTVRLKVRNDGKVLHELVLGTPQELAEHAVQMQKHPGMEHDEPHMVHVAPGKTGDMVWTFNRAGEFEFACLINGHYQAGMKGTIRVIATKAGKDQPTTAPAATATPQHGMHQHMQAGQPHGNMSGGMHRPSASGQPYAGEQQRQIKALSGQDIQAYENGQGHGFAKAAELNGYPGPLHTLEFANELKLSEAQRTQSQALLTQHKAEARRLGAELIEAERALDQAFASRSINTDMLNQFTRAAGEKLAQLRAEHLQTHLAQTALLTPQQIEHYKTLRGYGNAMPLHPGMQHNLQHHPMMEMNHGQHH